MLFIPFNVKKYLSINIANQYELFRLTSESCYISQDTPFKAPIDPKHKQLMLVIYVQYTAVTTSSQISSSERVPQGILVKKIMYLNKFSSTS
jgi:hypothetical protein